MDPVLPSQCHRTHRVLRQVIAQFQLRIVQEACEPLPGPPVGVTACDSPTFSKDRDHPSATTLSGPRRLIYEAHHNAHKRPLDQFAYGQFQRQFPADLDRTVIDPNKSANHEDTEQEAKSSPFADVAFAPADPAIDRREYQATQPPVFMKFELTRSRSEILANRLFVKSGMLPAGLTAGDLVAAGLR